jgi:hypothetical protein
MSIVNWNVLGRGVVILIISMSFTSCGMLQVSIETGESEKSEHALETEEAFDMNETETDNAPGLGRGATVESELHKATATADPTVTAVEEATQTSEATQAYPPPCSEDDWLILESQELGLSFEYPIMQQKLADVEYRFDEWPDQDWDPTGTFYDWSASRVDMSWRYAFAGGASKDSQEGRERWFTDVYRWVQDGDTFYLELSNDVFQGIEPLSIVTREDGLKGLIYKPTIWLEGSDEEGFVATLNFPEGYHEDLGSITFYFHQALSFIQIEYVLRSVTFQGN